MIRGHERRGAPSAATAAAAGDVYTRPVRTILRVTPLAAALALVCAACAPRPATQLRPASASQRWFGNQKPAGERIFRFDNQAEPEDQDPGKMSGQPDGRVARIMYEGLCVSDPKTLAPLPGQAYRWDVSADKRTYTFHMRPHLEWSDGTPLTARDFLWSWRRVLTPATAARYVAIMYPIRNAQAFNQDSTHRVRVEDVGLAAPDDSTFVVTLEHPTSYFLSLTTFYTFLPVPRAAIEKWGDRWTRPEHVVCNGAFVLDYWRQNDRFEFHRNPRYWDAAHVRLDRVIAYSVDDLNTGLNLYKSGVFDWLPSGGISAPFIPYLREYADYRTGDYQATYFYSVNVTQPPLDNVWLRRALEWSVDRDAIARDLLKGSRRPWGNLTPVGYPGYVHPPGYTYDPAKARACLARAGYPGGRGLPRLSILFNTSEDHRRIAEALQAMWKNVLGIDVELSNQEWGSYLEATATLHYQIARRSWIGDYLDPMTFLDMWTTGNGNNRTGWHSAAYDALIQAAEAEPDTAKRLAMLSRAEAIVLDQGIIIPIYHYTTNELVKPYVRGLYPNLLDVHELKYVWIDPDWRTRETPVAEAAPRR